METYGTRNKSFLFKPVELPSGAASMTATGFNPDYRVPFYNMLHHFTFVRISVEVNVQK